MEPNAFYAAEPKIKAVTKEEFEEFIKNYPRKLKRHASGISDPPAVSYNDFELADMWPYSSVAHTWLYSDEEGDYYYTPEDQRHYYVMENFEEVFASKFEREVFIDCIYKHFKGTRVKVLHFAMNTETEETMVVYEHLEDHKIYVRPYSMFISKVDRDKYPDVEQEYRFELVESIPPKFPIPLLGKNGEKRLVVNPDYNIAQGIIGNLDRTSGFCPTKAFRALNSPDVPDNQLKQDYRCPCPDFMILGKCECGLFVETDLIPSNNQ